MNTEDINPLAAAGLQRINFIPPHFIIQELVPNHHSDPFIWNSTGAGNMTIKIAATVNWAYENLSSRFYVGDVVLKESNNKLMVTKECIAFEDPAEATYYLLCASKI